MVAVTFEWSFVTDNAGELAHGLGQTLELSAIAIAGSFVVGAVLGAARAHRVPVVSQLAAAYVEVIRNTPILVQIFFLYFGLPEVGVTLRPFYVAALGFGWVGRHVFLILPQALRRLLPPLVSLLVNIIQNTTIAAVIGANELLESGKRSNERLISPPPIGLGENHAFEIFGAVAVVFFLISFPLTRLAAYLESRLQREAI